MSRKASPRIIINATGKFCVADVSSLLQVDHTKKNEIKMRIVESGLTCGVFEPDNETALRADRVDSLGLLLNGSIKGISQGLEGTVIVSHELSGSRGPQNFPKWCRGTVYRVDSIKKLEENRKTDGFTVIQMTERDEMTGEVEELDIYLTPPSGQFPSFLDKDKQRYALGKSSAGLRNNLVDVLRFNSTISALKTGTCVAWIGHSGCGKSTESNFLLMLFLKHMGEDGWPKVVAHRVGGVMYEYKQCADNIVQCTTQQILDLTALRQYSTLKDSLPQAEQPVLFLELGEDEQDPKIVPLTTFIAVSSRNIHNTLKTLKKSGVLETYVVRPHTPAELRMLGRLLYYEDRTNLLSNLGMGSNSSEAEAVAAIGKRVESVGPLPRIVLQRVAGYEEYVGEMKRSATAFLSKLPPHELSYNSIPSECSPFVAPHPVLHIDGTLVRGEAEFRFLCVRAATLIAEKTETPEQVMVMNKYGFAFQVVEAVLQCALRNLPSGEALHEGAQRDQWEWHRDPRHDKALTHDTIITDVNKIPLHQMCDRVARFSGTTFRRCASTLVEGVLYVSTMHNFKVGEFFTYDSGDASKGMSRSINYYQASSTPLPDHPFAVAALIDVFKSLRLFDSVNKDIKLNIVCLVDSSRSMTGIKGCRFTATKADLDEQAKTLKGTPKTTQKEKRKTRKGAASSAEVKVSGSDKSGGKKEETKSMAIGDLTKAFSQFEGRLCTYLVRADIYSISRFESTSR